MKLNLYYSLIFNIIFLIGQNSFALEIKALYLVERQKSTYQEQNWPDFFANALYLRAWLYEDDLRWTTPGLDQVISLEVLALAQHCQYDLATKISEEVLAHEKSSLINKNLINEAQGQIKLQKAFNHLEVSPIKEVKSSYSVSWPIAYAKILKVESIEQLKVRLENLCPDGES